MNASDRFESTKSRDPYPEIPCALLNSADIADYIAETGMIDPFHSDNLTSASYMACIEGPIYIYKYGEHDGPTLVDGNKGWTLRKNTIAYVNIEPYFRLPDYIALRFNLRVTLVHRGLLLGTGPMIDPGFVGKILIPLHNLTNNNYYFEANARLIAIEFTKTSPNRRWYPELEVNGARSGNYIEWRQNPWDNTFNFLERALENQQRKTVVSSMEGIRRDLESATKKAGHAVSLFRSFGVIGFLAVVVAMSGITYMTWSLIRDTRAEWNDYLEDVRSDIATRQDDQEQRLEILKQTINSIQASSKIPLFSRGQPPISNNESLRSELIINEKK